MTTSKHYSAAKKYMNRRVKIKTKYGSTFYGKIVKVSSSKVYLKVSSVSSSPGKAHISFFPFILPLVLFDLLVIALVDGRHHHVPHPHYPHGPYPGPYRHL
ncbi:hypothetical protein [Paenibacillus cineris]|uniref:hypothetical protein n=1 Tax=Paenibacillus cineris TaxID=237530 RepID=UPI001B139061|nr:hypothetical protein [Paenibacillus cineris]GIO63042.1 hypothetical protein J43TS9_46160 [Paenibacillus cineris]